MLFTSGQILQVSEITDLIKTSLERDFSSICVEGEISNFRPASSGHCYFSLKDNQAMLSAVLFRSSVQRMNFKPADGMRVVAKGRISVYKQRGNYQIICDSLKIAGQGDILQMLEERKQRLAQEGFFDQSHKQSLPAFPLRIGVITSPTGAAIRDILNVLKRRNPGLSVIVYPAIVQGESAANEIIQQIEYANLYPMVDTLIIGRGGGSLEDLLAFSDDNLVRAVYKSTIPIISAVGHEIDVALSDFAADLRAPTPSAAAELVTPDMVTVKQRIMQLTNELPQIMSNRIQLIKEKMNHLNKQSLIENFQHFLEPLQQHLDEATKNLVDSVQQRISDEKHRLALSVKELNNLSPLGLLERGYAYVTDKNGKNIKYSSNVKTKEIINIQLYQGQISAEVKDKNEKF